MIRNALKKLIDLIPLLVLAGVVWLGATAYYEHKSHRLAEDNLTTLTQALVDVIRAQQGGGGQEASGARGNPDSALTNPTQELPSPK